VLSHTVSPEEAARLGQGVQAHLEGKASEVLGQMAEYGFTPEAVYTGMSMRISVDKDSLEPREISMDISFVDLQRAGELDTVAELSKVQLGDTVKVIFPDLLDSAVESECTKTLYNVLTDAYDSITLGDRTPNAADSLAYEAKVVSAIDQQNDTLTIKLQATEDGLMSEVSRAAGTENELSSRITQNANAISAEVTNRQNGDSSVLTQTSNAISAEVTARNGAIASAITQLANSITLAVSNGTDRSTITLSGDGITTQSKVIRFTGDIVFESDLSTSGSTNINGANITTGKIAAARIDVDNLVAKQLKTGVYGSGGGYGLEIKSNGHFGSGDAATIGVDDRMQFNSGLTSYGANCFIDALYQTAGPTKPYCYSRNGHAVTFNWNDTDLELYVDNTKIGKFTVS
jgi:hypothetical protein